jgi:sulfhydrogenase subunit beta (sulfur reductase)
VHAPFLAPATRVLLDVRGFGALLARLQQHGYSLIGPRVVGPAISYQPIASIEDLPRGWTSRQAAGRYRLEPREDDAMFGYGPGVESLKRYLCPPVETLWKATRESGRLRFEPNGHAPAPALAFIGVRACELEAVARLDKVFLQGPFVDPAYEARRSAMFLLAVHCSHPGDTCFCASMGTGPRATSLFDMAFTELPGGRFVVEVGSARGAEALGDINWADAPADAVHDAEHAVEAAAARMGRQVDTTGLPEALADAMEHPEWDDVARRCLACANCALVCPTCFCHTVEDRTDLKGQQIERQRRWDTCFTAEFSYIHGGSIRPSVRARYRQWLTHKFSSWQTQFGTLGCVGCGRCITWCPVGIDVTEELRRLRG